MIRTLLLLATIVAITLSACPTSNDLPGLTAGTLHPSCIGSATFTFPTGNNAGNNGGNSTVYSHRFGAPFFAVPSIAMGIWDTALAVSVINSFGEFSVQSKASVVGVEFQWKVSSRAWRSLRIGFWANTRDDLYIGTYSANLDSLRAAASTQTVPFASIKNHQRSISRAFLNGFGLNPESKSIQLQIEARTIQETSLQVVITAGPDTSLKSVQFSYLIFSPSTASFASYGGVVSRTGFTGSGYQDISNSIYSPDLAIQGLVRLNAPLVLALSSGIDSDFVFWVKSDGAAVDFIFSYVVVGAPPRSVCGACDGKYAHGKECAATCPEGSYAFAFKDGGLACRRCSAKMNMAINSNKNGCACASGYELSNGNCVAVATNSMTTPSDFASTGVGQAGSSITSISQNNGKVVNVNTGAVITISGGSSGSVIGPTIATVINQKPPVNGPSGGITVIGTKPTDPNANSYIPTIPTQPVPSQPTVPPTVPPIRPPAQTAPTAQSCANYFNTYWTGYRCVCRVGYKTDPATGQCVKITILTPVTPPYVPPLGNCRDDEVFVYNQCVCKDGMTRGADGRCSLINNCPDNSYPGQGGVCICRQGFIKRNQLCIPNPPNQNCGPNSYFNGLVCICNPNYIYDPLGNCILGDNCPAYSTKVNGICQCINGYREIRPGVCSQCDTGAIFMGGQCVFTCGVNQVYNSNTRKCQCRAGYGINQGVCVPCPANFFLFNGYCVTCPLYATYNPQTNRCECPAGSQIVGGQCATQNCPTNQVWNPTTRTCRCVSGLGLLDNGQCGSCPAGTSPDSNTQRCTSSCLDGQVFSGGRCVCQPGLGITLAGSCARCETVNAALVGGYCVTCPNGKTWINGVCACPSGFSEVSGACRRTCGANQLVDASGNCYYCLLNEQIVNNACVCKQGFIRDPVTRMCSITCPTGQVLINDLCGTCAMGTVYNPQLRACVCPPDSFINQQGYCEKRVTPPITCSGPTYRNPSTNTCLPCDPSCSSCFGPSASACLTCANPFAMLFGGQCVVSRCGNGVVEAGEGCDDFNTIGGDGCSATCGVEQFFVCQGSPSICRRIGVTCGNGLPDAGETCDDRNTFNGDGCSANCQIEFGYTCTQASTMRPSFCTRDPPITIPSTGLTLYDVVINKNNVFVTLGTPTIFTFSSVQQMTSFIRYQIPAGFEPSSGYCRQRPTDLKLFDCLFNYPTGVKTTLYNIQFSYSKDGVNGYLSVPIDYTRSQTMARRSLK